MGLRSETLLAHNNTDNINIPRIRHHQYQQQPTSQVHLRFAPRNNRSPVTLDLPTCGSHQDHNATHHLYLRPELDDTTVICSTPPYALPLTPLDTLSERTQLSAVHPACPPVLPLPS